jgi:hypothetical protein
LIDAYRHGRIDRRAFIRGMVAVGMSVSLATALADQVRAAPAPAGRISRVHGQDDIYEPDDDIYEPEAPVALPSTGATDATSPSGWAKPLAVIGAGAALAAGAMRRLKGTEAKPE